MRKIRVITCDDDPRVLAVWRDMLGETDEIEIVGQAFTTEEYKNLAATARADVAIIDIWFGPHADGFSALEWTLQHTATRVIMASVDDTDIITCFRMGACSFIHKGAYENPVLAVKKVSAGHSFFPENIQTKLTEQLRRECLWSRLSGTEQYILKMRLRGLPRMAVYTGLNIAPATYDVHLRNIRRKLGMSIEEILQKLS